LACASWSISYVLPSGSYLVGASADSGDATAVVDWTVQVHKSRSLKEKLLGRNTMAEDDPLCALIEKVLQADTRVERVSVDREG